MLIHVNRITQSAYLGQLTLTVHVSDVNIKVELTILITHVCTLRLLPQCYLCLVINPLLH